MRKLLLMTAIAVSMAAVVVVGAGQGPGGADRLSLDGMKGIEIRSIGPGFVSGRIADIAVDPKNSGIWYVASAFGGLWKTSNRGITFEPATLAQVKERGLAP